MRPAPHPLPLSPALVSATLSTPFLLRRFCDPTHLPQMHEKRRMAAVSDAPEYLVLGKFAGSIAGVRRLVPLASCTWHAQRPASHTHCPPATCTSRPSHCTDPTASRSCACTNSPSIPRFLYPPLFPLPVFAYLFAGPGRPRQEMALPLRDEGRRQPRGRRDQGFDRRLRFDCPRRAQS